MKVGGIVGKKMEESKGWSTGTVTVGAYLSVLRHRG